MDNVKPDRHQLPVWLHYKILGELMQRLYEQDLDPQQLPDGWRALQTLQDRVTQHAQAITQDFTDTLHVLEAARRGPRPAVSEHGAATSRSREVRGEMATSETHR